MSKNRAVARPTEVMFYCGKCQHPLETHWNDVEGLMTPDEMGDEVQQTQRYVFCPNCGAKQWFPTRYVR